MRKFKGRRCSRGLWLGGVLGIYHVDKHRDEREYESKCKFNLHDPQESKTAS